MLSGVPTKSPCTLIRTLIGNLYCSMSEFFLVCPPGNPEAKGGRAGEEAGDGGRQAGGGQEPDQLPQGPDGGRPGRGRPSGLVWTVLLKIFSRPPSWRRPGARPASSRTRWRPPGSRPTSRFGLDSIIGTFSRKFLTF